MNIAPRYIASIENSGQHSSLQIFYELVSLLDISVDQFFFPDKTAGKNTERRQLDSLLDSMSDKGIKYEVVFSDLSPQEENQLYTCDQYFVNDGAEKSFFVAGKEITAKLLADALQSLPEEKRQAVLLYYFFDMKDAEIAELMKIPRSCLPEI